MGAAQAEVIVNRAPISGQLLTFLNNNGLQVASGRYWYDRVSGAWGYENGPIAGQIWPGLPVSAPLPADISRGNTGIFINGREITAQEREFIRAYLGYTLPGRYWVNAYGVGGPEGQGPMFDLSGMAPQGGNSVGHRARGGSVISDGTTSGFISSDYGVSVTCGPDGGCIY
ncbi:MAG: hypothetical protein MI864_05615 [Pseudomonadales bacterium]|uniref:Uncharacterized protein n=1 Tax=Oleiphilus messinensis TaxID=141451 RepID=A0A1Y0I534_9GAMM|nr:hypothetical protein [Oleiphilus messinensis]ARU54645.1 hypothetical protein OLMES_0542 [Oleiphilus messinensis]MCG8609995.1 hypothetical protein [Pseudomonadales bacterium]